MSEKHTGIRSLTMSTRMDVPVSMGTLEYIAGIDPRETWLPVSGQGMEAEEIEKLRKRHFEIVIESEKTKDFQDRLKKHLEECVNLYNGIMARKGDVVKPYIQGRKINFIIGMPRTGGTTLYQALSDAYGWPWEGLLLSMTHNYMPNGRYCLDHPASEFDMGWRLPWNFNSLIFELCQFLVYANNEAPDSENMFIKSTALSYAIKLLNFLFGDRANYYITLRHPGAITLTSGKEEIKRNDHMETMAIWANHYSGIVRECRPMGNIHIVEYGQGLTDTINSAFANMKFGERLENTSFFEYDDYDKEFYDGETARRMFDFVRMSWKLFDVDFPIPDKCI